MSARYHPTQAALRSASDGEGEPPPPRPRQLARRRCLMCGGGFASEGAHNRICDDCKAGEVWGAGDLDGPFNLAARGSQ